MRVLWVTNVEINMIAKSFGDTVVYGGWLEQTAERLAQDNDVELFIACNSQREQYDQNIDGVSFFSFNDTYPDARLRNRVNEIIELVNPDVVHIWGTEYRHSLLFVESCEDKGIIGRVVVSIQGLVSFISIHYYANLPERIVHHRTLKEIVRPNIYQSREIMRKNGTNEARVLKLVDHCIGRTDWDYACTKQINPDIRYHSVNEILRTPFYHSRPWAFDQCKKHTIFFSQANYPIKGFHFMLQALNILKERYPDVTLNVLGDDPFDRTITRRLKRSSYDAYLRELINKYNLQSHVHWLGRLTAEQMVSQYLNANVFVCSSSIENSSNSICEAMILGVPVVASDVGGIKSIMTHETEGILFHDEAYYMIADAVSRVFEDSSLASNLGANARLRALRTHDIQMNMKQLKEVYTNILGKYDVNE